MVAKKGDVQIAGKPMDAEELAAAEARMEGKRSPIHEDDFQLPKGEVIVTPDGREITKIGNFKAQPQVGDSQTLKKFARIEPDYEGWIPMTPKEALMHQGVIAPEKGFVVGALVGYDADKQLGLLATKGRKK